MISNIEAGECETTSAVEHDDQSDASADAIAPTVAAAAAAVVAPANSPASSAKENWVKLDPSFLESANSALAASQRLQDACMHLIQNLQRVQTADSVGENSTSTTQTQHVKSS